MRYLIVAAALAVAGCDEPQGVENHINTVYIIFDGCNKVNIIHSESCPCKGDGAK